jgi:hypothetical protein
MDLPQSAILLIGTVINSFFNDCHLNSFISIMVLSYAIPWVYGNLKKP